MGSGNVIAGVNRLRHAVKALQDSWQVTEETWNDGVRRKFEERYILPIDPAIEAALNGMQKMAEVLDKVRRDCTDRSEML